MDISDQPQPAHNMTFTSILGGNQEKFKSTMEGWLRHLKNKEESDKQYRLKLSYKREKFQSEELRHKKNLEQVYSQKVY